MTSVFDSESSTTKLFAEAQGLTQITYPPSIGLTEDYDATILVGKKEYLKSGIASLDLNLGVSILDTMIESIGDKKGGSASTFVDLGNDKVHKVVLCGLPLQVSRNNHAMSVHKITSLLGENTPKSGNTRVVVTGIPSESDVVPVASAIAKAYPIFNMKTSESNSRQVCVSFQNENQQVYSSETTLAASFTLTQGVQLAARLVDTHPEELTTDQYALECRAVVDQLNANAGAPVVSGTEIMGKSLHEKGYGGLWGVGKAATCPPRLIVLEYNGGDEETVALVGKGIVYDTGGLSLKPKTGMAGMKHDMGGSAGLLGAFYTAVSLKVKKHIYLILCLAENAISHEAFRNDDILTMYSGKTVEVNNCDAEGRLVLGDGVAHATQNIDGLDLVVDMATLTGAQLVCTGKTHAGILSSTQEVETRAVEAGAHSGDLCFPMVYAPELLMDEFESKVADMKNSVKDRSNAQASCAGHFIEAHLAPDYKGGWLHIDMAGPGTNKERGTGYGVGLICSLLKVPGCV